MTFKQFALHVNRLEPEKKADEMVVLLKSVAVQYTYDAPADETEILWKCLNCGELKPRNEWVLSSCPACGASKSEFVLVDED
jgi:rubrerythrin